MWHVHIWQEVQRNFVPPAYGFKGEGIPHDTGLKVLFGFTTIELRCKTCFDVKFVEAQGDARTSRSVAPAAQEQPESGTG